MHVGLSKNTATRETQNGIEGIVSINKMLFQPTSGLMESRKRGSLPLYTKGAGGQQLAALIFHFVLFYSYSIIPLSSLVVVSLFLNAIWFFLASFGAIYLIYFASLTCVSMNIWVPIFLSRGFRESKTGGLVFAHKRGVRFWATHTHVVNSNAF